MNKHPLTDYRWAFMGSPQIAVDFLDSLNQRGIVPELAITNPPKKVGRHRTLTGSPVALWAEVQSVACSTKKPDELIQTLCKYDFVCVFAYGSLLSQKVLDSPRCGTVNIHPSLLPNYRGPSPITTAILDDCKRTGVSLMQLVLEMDAGPVLAQSPVDISEWSKYQVHEREMAQVGASLFADYMHDYCQGRILPQEQNHAYATLSPRYKKQDMQIDRTAPDYEQYLHFCAFPKPFFIDETGKRVVITQAKYEQGEFRISKVIPEGKREQNYQK